MILIIWISMKSTTTRRRFRLNLRISTDDGRRVLFVRYVCENISISGWLLMSKQYGMCESLNLSPLSERVKYIDGFHVHEEHRTGRRKTMNEIKVILNAADALFPRQSSVFGWGRELQWTGMSLYAKTHPFFFLQIKQVIRANTYTYVCSCIQHLLLSKNSLTQHTILLLNYNKLHICMKWM